MGRTAVVENKPGAGGNIAAEYVARRPADGSMIMVGTAALCEINPLVFDHLHWSMTDFAPLVKGVQSPLVLVANPSVPGQDARSGRRLGESQSRQAQLCFLQSRGAG